MENLSQFETDLWSAADNLRANSKLTSSDYFMPVLGIIFLRHAANRFDTATRQIADDQASGKMPKRKILPADYIRRRTLFLPESARYDVIMERATVNPGGLPELVTGAMTAIEAEFEPLLGVLPKDYGIFEPKVLEELMRLFNSEQIKKASGDVFGRIYEYFLAKFSIQKAHDNGEFFTPSSLVQLIVNVIEPDHGNVCDLACGSAGMFVQTSHFIEQEGGDAARKVVFYGQEKNRDTIRIAKMNLAVHGLEGKIAEAITYYQDEHTLFGNCDFVMANPPFNVDLVDAERIKNDPRLPFGLPGVNKDKRVSNGNYLWISYFWSYLKPTGRAGFVMSSQASSAGNDEKTVRQKIVETGDVDVMISIKGGFFYTRTVPCELWFFDRTKPSPSAMSAEPSPSPPAPLPKVEGSNYRGGYDFAGLVDKARELRKTQTPAEEVLWQVLRNRQVADLKFRRQHQIGDYITDFYCDGRKLVIELDGGIHEEPAKAKHDAKRQKYLESLGLTVLRFGNEEVLNNIEKVLVQISAANLPSPAGRRAGEEGGIAQNQKGNVLMLDARSIGQLMKGSRKVHEFTPEQMRNLTAIVWLYRGQQDRFLGLVRDYFGKHAAECADVPDHLASFDHALSALDAPFAALAKALKATPDLDPQKSQTLGEIFQEISDARKAYATDAKTLLDDLAATAKKLGKSPPSTNAAQHQARQAFDPMAERAKGLIKQADYVYKLASRCVEAACTLTPSPSPKGRGEHRAVASASDLPLPLGEGRGEGEASFNPRDLRRLLKDLEEARRASVEQLKLASYFHRQITWLHDRFPKAEMQPVPGLCKVVTRKEIAAADWSLTPGRYVGVAPAEVDEDFDFEQAITEIHTELAGLNAEATELAATIQKNLEELGV